MKKGYLSTALGFVLLAIIVFFLWKVSAFFVLSLIAADPKYSTSIIGAMATVFVGLTAVIITQKQIKLREVAESHRAKKVEIYEAYLSTIKAMTAGENDKVSLKAPTEQELVDYLVEFKTELLLWGSPEIIKCQLEFQTAGQNNGDVFLAIDRLYQAIRKDIGLSNKGLGNLELIKLSLKNPEELDTLRASNKPLKNDAASGAS